MRSLLAGPGVTHLAGVYDPLTAALARAAGFRAAHLSGAAVAALALGLPDLGYVHGTHIAGRAATITPALGGVPLLADADTGYGTAVHAVWTARRYAAAGVAGLHIEDQVSPKRCGHLAGKEVVDAGAAAGKIRAVAEAGTGLVVVARTDAFSVTGLSDAIERSRRYVAAGADAVFVEGVSDRAGLADVHDALPGVPLVVNRSEAGGPTEDGLPDGELAALGVRLVLHPVAPLLAALEAARAAYAAIAHAGHAGAVPRLSWHGFTGLVGQPDALALDSRYGGPS
ncbi:oxaloacetate decarboxylase [Dactylosporangium sucinum]|uniref:Methylisocitrate lyase n=1 Tax=Dactylosporangium sucinum TaxID=1424081 RepID=A0A917T0W9_9ACTN|nr:isocitrate lyase/PEP mutase family protein [Dactylosporangium sucinum]GGM05807.1 hypothetical protein GCM10007977_003680 [Dactylosporangium sucinum]